MLKAELEHLGIAGRVHLLGDRIDVPDLLAGMDLFVLPSRWEGLSVSIMEAMAAGLAVVATDVGGTAELVVNGETGLLVPPADVQALARAVTQLLQDESGADRMGRLGRRRVLSKFTHARMVEQVESLYVSLLIKQGLKPGVAPN